VKDTKNLVLPITWGADLRLRNEYVYNALTLSDGGARHEQDYFRFREPYLGFRHAGDQRECKTCAWQQNNASG